MLPFNKGGQLYFCIQILKYVKREIVKVDENLCNGCGDCVPACHEGALQIIDGKARLVSDLMCDGLGACLGYCPQGAITIEEREAEPYDEIKVIEIMVGKGKNTVIAHIKHLKEHNETKFLKQAISFLIENKEKIDFNVEEVIQEVYHSHQHQFGGGCPGSRPIEIKKPVEKHEDGTVVSGKSELRQWPVQMHLINPSAGHFTKTDVLLAADCTAFSMGNFHQEYLKGKSLVVACPKLDQGIETYVEKIRRLIDDAGVNTITVMMMQVPCCSGLLQIVKTAQEKASRKVPVKAIVVSVEGKIMSEEWI